MYRKGRAWIELNAENLKKNVEFFRRVLPEKCRLMPAVKADAYGHGAALIAAELNKLGISDFCVASAQEGAALRGAGIEGRILVLGYTHPENLGLLQACRLTQTVVDIAYADVLRRSGKNVLVQIGVDTGMHRLGIDWENLEEIQNIWRTAGFKVTGIYSHLCAADERGEEAEAFTRLQIARFAALTDRLQQAGIRGFSSHLQGSYGILNYPECVFDYARPGIALYGILSGKEDRTKIAADLHPVLSLKARIQCIRQVKQGEGAGYGLAFLARRDTRLAVLSAGYADGIPRNLGERGHVLVCGKEAPVAGRICMDQMLVDVTEIPEARAGEEAVLIGTQGERTVTMEQYAAWSGTIANEIASRLGARLERLVC